VVARLALDKPWEDEESLCRRSSTCGVDFLPFWVNRLRSLYASHPA
jgi:hypothetical protein